MLLAVSFIEFITKLNVIVGMIVCCLGVACILLARRFTQAVDKTDKVTKSSKAYIGAKITGLILVLVGMILIALPL